MRVAFDPEVRAWYLALSDAPVARTVHISDEVLVDVTTRDDIVGVEFLLAPAELDDEVVRDLFDRFPTVRAALSEFQALAVA